MDWRNAIIGVVVAIVISFIPIIGGLGVIIGSLVAVYLSKSKTVPDALKLGIIVGLIVGIIGGIILGLLLGMLGTAFIGGELGAAIGVAAAVIAIIIGIIFGIIGGIIGYAVVGGKKTAK